MRLFIGLPLQEDLQRRLELAWNSVLNTSDDCREIDPKSWHITIAHLGNVDEANQATLRALFETATEKPPTGDFFIYEFRTFPVKHPTHIVAHVAPGSRAIWKEYILRLRDMLSLVAPDIDRRPWIPHISISRSKKRAVLPEMAVPIPEPIIWTPNRISIVESKPSQDGAIYTDIYDIPFNI
ncbi:MAG: RNA 2',3'-cyclic phosphodiesterase [bacterium]|nr:RNA 2',3'-cyclic phosphodiesterase [bacterium]